MSAEFNINFILGYFRMLQMTVKKKVCLMLKYVS